MKEKPTTMKYELATVKVETICLAARHLQKKQDPLAIDSMQHNLRVLNITTKQRKHLNFTPK